MLKRKSRLICGFSFIQAVLGYFMLLGNGVKVCLNILIRLHSNFTHPIFASTKGNLFTLPSTYDK